MTFKSNINILLLSGIGFFATWGEGMQKIFPRVTFIYPSLILIYLIFNLDIIAYLLFGKKKVIPSQFKWLYLFITIHTFFYVLLNINNISFGLDYAGQNEEGFTYGISHNGNTIIRYFFFLVFCVVLSQSFQRLKYLKVFSSFFVIGFCLTLILNGASHEYGNLYRYSGGLKDPNTMAFDGIISLMFSLFLYAESKSPIVKIKKLLLLVSIIVETIAITFSFSRAAWLTLVIFIILYFLRRRFKGITKFILAFIVVVIVSQVMIKKYSISTDVIKTRFSLKEMEETKGANRELIWETYISRIDDYLLYGTGIGNSQTIIAENREGLAYDYETHNLYLQFLVEYGVFGLLLYLLYLFGIIKTYRKTNGSFYYLICMGILMMIDTFFLNIDKGRTYWIVLATVNYIWMRNRQLTKKSRC